MDALTSLLDGPKARGAFLLKSVLEAPWSLRIEDRAPVSVITMVQGDAWLLPEHGDPVPLTPGDLAIVRGPDPYTVADAPDTPVQVVVGADQRCNTGDADVTESMSLGVRTWGDTPTASSSVMLSGTYQESSEIGRRLLDAIPPVLIRPAEADHHALVSLLTEEIAKDQPGQELVLDRLLDLLLVSVLRTWLASPGNAPAWYRAQGDPVVGSALQLIHERPAAPWTVASLAATVGASRAGLARRFSALVGEPPMAYLANWRLTLAADLLREPDTTVASVARTVGYGSAFALSAAFKRVRGMSPQEYRAGGQPIVIRPPEASEDGALLGS